MQLTIRTVMIESLLSRDDDIKLIQLGDVIQRTNVAKLQLTLSLEVTVKGQENARAATAPELGVNDANRAEKKTVHVMVFQPRCLTHTL